MGVSIERMRFHSSLRAATKFCDVILWRTPDGCIMRFRNLAKSLTRIRLMITGSQLMVSGSSGDGGYDETGAAFDDVYSILTFSQFSSLRALPTAPPGGGVIRFLCSAFWLPPSTCFVLATEHSTSTCPLYHLAVL
ncbi:hypothetical protein TYRP_020746 [Tyrophagus putrescentiae]|nr:hypothetical protein TYRP_020746 [Tyrophagus putrescentiae]